MGAVFEYYTNQEGEVEERVWKVSDDIRFMALIKCYVRDKGKQKIIEKPSKRPATFTECCRFAEKLKREYGCNLKHLFIWNMDRLKEIQIEMEFENGQ